MKRLPSTLPNMILSLVLITAVAGALLGLMYSITKDPIAAQAKEAQVAAIRQVAPPFDNDPEAMADTVVTKHQVTCVVYPALKDGKLRGAAVKATTNEGFNGEVTIMVGFDADGTVRDYRVLHQAETPGLGAKMADWFRDPKGDRSIIGKNPATVRFYVTKDTGKQGQVDGITAATISSRAFLRAVRDAYKTYKSYSENPQP